MIKVSQPIDTTEIIEGKVAEVGEINYLICLGDQGEILVYDLDFEDQQELLQPNQIIKQPLVEGELDKDRLLLHQYFLDFLDQE